MSELRDIAGQVEDAIEHLAYIPNLIDPRGPGDGEWPAFDAWLDSLAKIEKTLRESMPEEIRKAIESELEWEDRNDHS